MSKRTAPKPKTTVPKPETLTIARHRRALIHAPLTDAQSGPVASVADAIAGWSAYVDAQLRAERLAESLEWEALQSDPAPADHGPIVDAWERYAMRADADRRALTDAMRAGVTTPKVASRPASIDERGILRDSETIWVPVATLPERTYVVRGPGADSRRTDPTSHVKRTDAAGKRTIVRPKVRRAPTDLPAAPAERQSEARRREGLAKVSAACEGWGSLTHAQRTGAVRAFRALPQSDREALARAFGPALQPLAQRA